MNIIRAHAFSGYCDVARNIGFNPDSVLRSVGLSENYIRNTNHDSIISLSQVKSIFDRTSQMNDCEYFGILFGKMQKISALGDIGIAIKHAESVRSGLRILQENREILWQKTCSWHIYEDNNSARIVFTFDSSVDNMHFAEATVISTFKMIKYICSEEIHPVVIKMAHNNTRNIKFNGYLENKIKFNQDNYELIFPKRILNAKTINGDNEISSALERYLNIIRSRESENQHDDLNQIKRLIENLLPNGNCNIVDISSYVSMNTRSFQRLLFKHNTTFSKLLEHCRREKAELLLKNNTLSLDNMPSLLGYSDVASFGRAFKKWHGISPGKYRNKITGLT